MILIEHLSKSFGERRVLDKISFSINSGECLFILGKSGVGKSVLLKHIVGLVAPDEGSVTVGDHRVNPADEKGLIEIRRRCGLVFQFPALLDSVSVFENISFGIRARGLLSTAEEIDKRVKEQLAWVGLDESVLELYPGELSYGAQKRVSIARTLAVSPEYLLFDEPTTSMDPVATAGLNGLIKRLTVERKVTTVVVSHDVKSALTVASRIILLEEGRLVFDGAPEKFKSATALLAQEFQKGFKYGIRS